MDRREAILAVLAVGAMAGAPASLAQSQRKVWRVGFLALGSAASSSQITSAFLTGMQELGYVEGSNLIVEWRFADGEFERLPPMASDLARSKVDVIVAVASAAISAAQKATATIPIVMATTGDPVGSGFVRSLAHPGGNITGLSNMGGEIGPKLLDLTRSILPTLSRVGLLVSPTSTTYRAIVDGILDAAQKVGVKALVAEASTAQEIDDAFAMMVREKAEAAIVGAAPFLSLQRRQIAELALKSRIPLVCGNRSMVEAGGLMSYAQDFIDAYRRSATYVDRILKGAKPADLPVEQPTQLELVVNLKTAKVLGITIPQSVLLRADKIIE